MTSSKSSDWTKALLALGIVFGDIGTSPLYALREVLRWAPTEVESLKLSVLGSVSLMVWALTIVVGMKYVWLLLKAHHQGAGGIFALYAGIRSMATGGKKQRMGWLLGVTLMGAALFYGDSFLSPAMAVLSAVEGINRTGYDLSTGTTSAIAMSILLLLFSIQRRGAWYLGRCFGPVMLLWFGTLGVLGFLSIREAPEVLKALSPWYAWELMVHHPGKALLMMAAALLSVTGCEALFADMGTFGAKAIRQSWWVLVYPALMFNYLGQAGSVLSDPSAVSQPFFSLVSGEWVWLLIGLATFVTILASQAVITAVFHLTQQAIHLGFLPRLRAIATENDERRQNFFPQVNWIMAIGCSLMVWIFPSSSQLANAYGFSVASGMLITSFLLGVVMKEVWNWSTRKMLLIMGAVWLVEILFWAGSLVKLASGAWLPLIATLCIWILIKTWRDGRGVLMKRAVRHFMPVSSLVDEMQKNKILRVKGVGIFLSASSEGLPLVLLHHLKHNKVLHDRVILLTVKFSEMPYVKEEERSEVIEIAEKFERIILHYGFLDQPHVMRDLGRVLNGMGVALNQQASFYQSRELLSTDGPSKMASWRKKLFVFLSRSARPSGGFFHLPPRQVIELGIQFDL